MLPRQPKLLPGTTRERERAEAKAGTKRDASGGDSQNRLGDKTSDRVRFKINLPKGKREFNLCDA